MLRLGNVYGPFSDWVRSAHGIAFITDSRRRKLDLTRSSVHQVYLDLSGLFVIAFTSARGTSRFLYSGQVKGRRLPSLWDWECVIHGPPASQDGGLALQVREEHLPRDHMEGQGRRLLRSRPCQDSEGKGDVR